MIRRIITISIIVGFLALTALVSTHSVFALTPTMSMTPSNTPTAATGSLPDLTVVSITEFTYTVPTPTANTQGCWPSGPTSKIGLRVTVQNIGTANAGAFVVNLNGSVLNVSGLAAGQSTAVDYMGGTLTRTRTATVDATGLVAESNENNNVLTVTLSAATSTSTGTPPPQICVTRTPTPTPTSVTSSQIDLTISSITYVGSNPPCLNSPKDNVVVTNLGTAAAGTFFVSINGTMTYQVNGLAAGQSVTVVVPAMSTITAVADSSNLIAESNESNNSLTVNLPIPTQAPTCTPTFTATPSLTITRTPTKLCITATPERLMVAPVTSPTSAMTQVISVTLNNGTSVTITSEAGTFTSSTKVGNVFSVTINLVPNSANHLQVQGTVNAANLCAPYTLSTTVDSSGNPLTIVQGSGPVTLTPTRTPSPTPIVCGSTNVALNKPATSSSNENAGLTPNLAVDGNTSTRWSSAFSDPQWIQIDLGTQQSICRVKLTWEVAYGKAYQIQASADGVTWTTIYSTTTGDGGSDDLTGLHGNGRYVRIYGTVRGTGYGYSLWELAIYH